MLRSTWISRTIYNNVSNGFRLHHHHHQQQQLQRSQYLHSEPIINFLTRSRILARQQQQHHQQQQRSLSGETIKGEVTSVNTGGRSRRIVRLVNTNEEHRASIVQLPTNATTFKKGKKKGDRKDYRPMWVPAAYRMATGGARKRRKKKPLPTTAKLPLVVPIELPTAPSKAVDQSFPRFVGRLEERIKSLLSELQLYHLCFSSSDIKRLSRSRVKKASPVKRSEMMLGQMQMLLDDLQARTEPYDWSVIQQSNKHFHAIVDAFEPISQITEKIIDASPPNAHPFVDIAEGAFRTVVSVFTSRQKMVENCDAGSDTQGESSGTSTDTGKNLSEINEGKVRGIVSQMISLILNSDRAGHPTKGPDRVSERILALLDIVPPAITAEKPKRIIEFLSSRIGTLECIRRSYAFLDALTERNDELFLPIVKAYTRLAETSSGERSESIGLEGLQVVRKYWAKFGSGDDGSKTKYAVMALSFLPFQLGRNASSARLSPNAENVIKEFLGESGYRDLCDDILNSEKSGPLTSAKLELINYWILLLAATPDHRGIMKKLLLRMISCPTKSEKGAPSPDTTACDVVLNAMCENGDYDVEFGMTLIKYMIDKDRSPTVSIFTNTARMLACSPPDPRMGEKADEILQKMELVRQVFSKPVEVSLSLYHAIMGCYVQAAKAGDKIAAYRAIRLLTQLEVRSTPLLVFVKDSAYYQTDLRPDSRTFTLLLNVLASSPPDPVLLGTVVDKLISHGMMHNSSILRMVLDCLSRLKEGDSRAQLEARIEYFQRETQEGHLMVDLS